jgi:hypothetical protein
MSLYVEKTSAPKTHAYQSQNVETKSSSGDSLFILEEKSHDFYPKFVECLASFLSQNEIFVQMSASLASYIVSNYMVKRLY